MNSVINPDALLHVPLFRNLNESELRQMIDVLRVRNFSPGELVIRQGDQSRDLWIVMEGQCEVVRRLKSTSPSNSHDETLVLAVLEPHTHFGEMSFFHPAPHSADVRARSKVKLFQITHTDYGDMILEGIGAAYKLAYNVAQQLAERLRRMDEWVSELANNPTAVANVTEFSRFRTKVFDGWSL